MSHTARLLSKYIYIYIYIKIYFNNNRKIVLFRDKLISLQAIKKKFW